MRTFIRMARLLFVALFVLSFANCDDDENPVQDLPSACQSRGTFAIAVLNTEFTCAPTNAFLDGNQALGAPDAESTGDGKLLLKGFVSLGVDGAITLFMGSCIQDLPGDDLRVFQSVSREALEVQVSQSQDGPFVSLGIKECVDRLTERGWCGFDLAGSGLNNVRVVRVIDREKLYFIGAQCDNAGPSPGADIDAVEVLHAGS